MKKLVTLVFAMLFLCTGIASASEFTLTGEYEVEGTYKDNITGVGTDVETYGNFEHELDLWAKFKIDDKTKVILRLEMRDELWGENMNANGTSSSESTYPASPDDNIAVEYAYGQHTFDNGGTLSIGLMNAGEWGTSFHNHKIEEYRIKYLQKTAIGKIGGIYHKYNEDGNPTTGDDFDSDRYTLMMVAKASGVKIMPMLIHIDASETGKKIYASILALQGKAGIVSWETEGVYKEFQDDPNVGDYTIFGLYGKIEAQLDALAVGGVLAYGSYDKDKGKAFDFRDEFEAGGPSLLLGEEMNFNGKTNECLNAATLIAAYVSFAASDDFTVGAYLGYADSNVEDNWTAPTKWDGADAWEVSATGAYKITPNLTYEVGAGVGQISYGDGSADPDRAMIMKHGLYFSF